MDPGMPSAGGSEVREIRVTEVFDERDAVSEGALALIASAFRRPDRQPISELRSEIEEKRLGLLTAFDFHLLAALDSEGVVVGTASGLYLAGVNAGFITYLTVVPAARGRGVAARLRRGLVRCLRDDASAAGHPDLAWVLGEVRAQSRWFDRLVRKRGVLAFDLEYFHPGMEPGRPHERYLLYRQPVGDRRRELPVGLVRQILYAIYRRGYRVRYPTERPAFRMMLESLEGKKTVAPHPEFHGATDPDGAEP
jgi:GNAT superfamily N-acetyltransferase